MIRTEHLTKRFGRFKALDDVSLEIERGEAVALWGPNGAGKSTLVRCLLGLLPFRGRATIGGLDVRREGKAARRLLGYLPQEPALFDDLRVGEVASLFARLRRVERAEARRLVEEADLGAHARKRVRELSGGMKQRLALGLALLGDPPVLLLDEPTSNLDTEGRGELLGDVERLRSAGKTVLLISHRPEEVRRIADRIVTLESGRIVRSTATRRDDDVPRAPVLVDESRVDAALDVLRDAGLAARRGEAEPSEETSSGDEPEPPGGGRGGRTNHRMAVGKTR